jgi:hypothetical protein
LGFQHFSPSAIFPPFFHHFSTIFPQFFHHLQQFTSQDLQHTRLWQDLPGSSCPGSWWSSWWIQCDTMWIIMAHQLVSHIECYRMMKIYEDLHGLPMFTMWICVQWWSSWWYMMIFMVSHILTGPFVSETRGGTISQSHCDLHSEDRGWHFWHVHPKIFVHLLLVNTGSLSQDIVVRQSSIPAGSAW